MNPVTLIEVFLQPGFLIGLGLGGVAGLIAGAHRRTDLWLASVGAAAILALVLNDDMSRLPVPPLALVAVGAGAVVLGAFGVWRMAQEAGPVAVGLCVTLTALGVWGTVPDTENARVLLGAASGGAFGGLWLSGARGSGVSVILGAAVMLAVVAFISLTEGLARPSAPIGSLATLGVFLLYPLRLWREVPVWALVAAHVALVIVCGRIAGQASGAGMAAVIALLALALAGGSLAVFSRWRLRP